VYHLWPEAGYLSYHVELNEERYLRYNDSTYMVSVAKWLRRQVVALEIEGSNPSVHPRLKFKPGEGVLFPLLLRLYSDG
jgi:hypothetical protein